TGWKQTLLTEMIAQAQAANCGLAANVYKLSGGRVEVDSGYWYRDPLFQLEGSTTTATVSDVVLKAAVDGDVVVFTATPLGSERRVANVSNSGHPSALAPLSGPSITMAGTEAITANSDVPAFTDVEGSTLDAAVFNPVCKVTAA